MSCRTTFSLPRPRCRFGGEWKGDIRPMREAWSATTGRSRRVILEPVVQGAGGMHFYHPMYLRRVRELCDAFDVLLIADEIATGFGRTGGLFACRHAGVSPGIMCWARPDRRLHDPGRDPGHGARGRGRVRRGARRVHARAGRSWAIPWPAPWRGRPSTCWKITTGPRKWRGSDVSGRRPCPCADLSYTVDVRTLGYNYFE